MSIPWGVVLYLYAYVGLTTWAFAYQLATDDRRPAIMVIQGMTDVVLIACGIAYWQPTLHAELDAALQPMFSLAVIMLLAQMASTAKRKATSAWVTQMVAGKPGALLLLVSTTPLLIWGYHAAILKEHVGLLGR